MLNSFTRTSAQPILGTLIPSCGLQTMQVLVFHASPVTRATPTKLVNIHYLYMEEASGEARD